MNGHNDETLKDGIALAAELETVHDIARYATLGLIANPFAAAVGSDEPAVACEIAAEGNRFLGVVLEQSKADSPKPVWVEKSEELPAYYGLMAISHAEASLATDDSLNVLYAYVQLYMMKIGVVRATLGILAERLSFRDFDRTLAAFVERMLAEPDTELPSYGLLGPDGLEAFAIRFREDPLGTLEECFGTPEIERRPELAEVADIRHLDLDDDGEESESTAEVDATIGDAPGTTLLLAESADAHASDEAMTTVRDYIIEYARTHVSPVVARGLRMYHDRGLVAMSDEFKITKAPRKTLDALVRFARHRFQKVALIFDGFDDWNQIPVDLRSKIVGSLSDMRWKLAGNAFLVMMIQGESAPELHETFSTGTLISWDFPGLVAAQSRPDEIERESVDRWLASAALPGATPLSLDDPMLARMVELSEGSFARFATMANRAIDDAAARRVAQLDEASVEAARE